MNERIAELEVVAIRPNGERFIIDLAVGRPYPDPKHEGTWRCPVSLAGLDNRVPDLAGVGSLQALCIAMNFIRRRLLDTRDQGIRFFTREESQEVELPLDAYFVT